MGKKVIERMHQELGNLVRKFSPQEEYFDDVDSWIGILAASAFMARSPYPRTKDKSPVQMVFSEYMILPINHIA